MKIRTAMKILPMLVGTLVASTVLPELSIRKVTVLVPPNAIVSGTKALPKVGCGFTVNVSLAEPLLPDDDVKSPLVLTNTPAATPVTATLTEQLLAAATVPPL